MRNEGCVSLSLGRYVLQLVVSVYSICLSSWFYGGDDDDDDDGGSGSGNSM